MHDPLIYEKKILIRSEQVDMTRRLRMSDLFRLLEEASIAHTELLGCTRDKTLDKGLLWIITRQLVEIDEMPEYDEEILVRSWQGEMQHVFFPRFYEIERKGRVVIRGQALWMLMEEETRTMAMPEDYDIFIPGRPDADDMVLPAVVVPKSAGEAVESTALVTRFSQSLHESKRRIRVSVCRYAEPCYLHRCLLSSCHSHFKMLYIEASTIPLLL